MSFYRKEDGIMKKSTKIMSVLLAAACAASMTGCGGSGSTATTAAASEAATEAASSEEAKSDAAASTDGKTYNVGICQLVQHVALDAATQGFKDALTDALGDAVTFDEQNAQGDSNTCSTIINSFVSNHVDLILANATPSLQAAKNVGLLYCSAEANSQYQVDTVKAALEEMGYTCEYYAFSDSNDLATITTNAATNSDVIYVPTDNTVAANTEIVNNICQPAKVPVIAGEEGICSGCGVATLSISYYDLGVATGKMAVKILTGEANVSEMPIEYAPQFTKKYNKTICDALEITVPDDYVAIEE